MKRKVDVLVIGGGVVGVCSAYFLSEKGREVTLVEKGDICSGSSYGNAGLIVPSHSIPFANPDALSKGIKWMFNPDSPFFIKPRLSIELMIWLWKFYRASRSISRMKKGMKILNELALESLLLYKELADKGGLDFGFEQRGLLIVSKSEKNLEKLAEECRLMDELGMETRVLDKTGIAKLIPETSLDVYGGAFFPRDAHIVPNRFVEELANFTGKNKTDVHTSTVVIGFETSGTKITAVKTDRGDFEPREVVLAGGAWSPVLARDLGVTLHIQPAKGYSITVDRPENFTNIPLLFSEAKVIVTPMGDRLRFGGTLEFAGLDLSINDRRVQAIRQAARDYIKDLDASLFETSVEWSGLRPCSPDGLPYLGRPHNYENLVIATGHGMLGMTLGPVTGKLVAMLIEKESIPYDLTPLSIERFN